MDVGFLCGVQSILLAQVFNDRAGHVVLACAEGHGHIILDDVTFTNGTEPRKRIVTPVIWDAGMDELTKRNLVTVHGNTLHTHLCHQSGDVLFIHLAFLELQILEVLLRLRDLLVDL